MSAGIDRARWWAVAAILLGGLLAGYAACLWSSTEAYPHDIYSNVYEFNAPKDGPRKLCCGGDPVNGDCEGLTYEDMQEVEGGIRIVSKRYKAVIFVPRHRIQWDIPRDGYSGEAADKTNSFPLHWCGKPRTAAPGWPVGPDNPDPNYVTFCAFLAPGGV